MITPSAQVAARHRSLVGCNIGRRPLCDDAPAFHAAARSHVDDPVGATDQVQVVLDDEDRRSPLDEVLQHVEEDLHVVGVQADGRLVKDEQRPVLAPSHLRGQLESLRLAAGQGGCGLPQRQVAQT